jgi:hypothetical protein
MTDTTLSQTRPEAVRVQVTTKLQGSGPIVTAEPYFAVTQPSDVVGLENAGREGTNDKASTSGRQPAYDSRPARVRSPGD